MVRWVEMKTFEAADMVTNRQLFKELTLDSPKPVLIRGALKTMSDKAKELCSFETFRDSYGERPCTEVLYTGFVSENCNFSCVNKLSSQRCNLKDAVERILAGSTSRVMHYHMGPNSTLDLLRGTPFMADHLELPWREEVAGVFYLTGRGTYTAIHHDRELNQNLHFCLAGTKRVIYFDADQAALLYKYGCTSDSLVDFRRRKDEDLFRRFPALKHAVGCDVLMHPGDVLYMPEGSWHYMEYTEPNLSYTFAYYSSNERKKGLKDKESALFMTLANPLQQQSAVQRTLVLAVSICFVSWWTLVYPYMRAHCARKFHLSWCYNLVGVFNVGVNILVERLTELYPSFCKYFFRQ